jgi:hypothetical protein
MNKRIAHHANFNADDYLYLRAKGWTDEAILARWDDEATRGAGPCCWEVEAARAKLAAVTRSG